MPIEVRRFGVGNRRPDGPPGTVGVTAGASTPEYVIDEVEVRIERFAALTKTA